VNQCDLHSPTLAKGFSNALLPLRDRTGDLNGDLGSKEATAEASRDNPPPPPRPPPRRGDLGGVDGTDCDRLMSRTPPVRSGTSCISEVKDLEARRFPFIVQGLKPGAFEPQVN
jgi:hypothetical protein